MVSGFKNNEKTRDQFYKEYSVHKWINECKMKDFEIKGHLAKYMNNSFLSRVFIKENNDQTQSWQEKPTSFESIGQITKRCINYFLDQRKLLNTCVALGMLLNLMEHQFPHQ